VQQFVQQPRGDVSRDYLASLRGCRLGTDEFPLKLNGLGKFYPRHRPSIRRKIGFTGETIQTKMSRKIKFISLGALRQRERVDR